MISTSNNSLSLLLVSQNTQEHKKYYIKCQNQHFFQLFFQIDILKLYDIYLIQCIVLIISRQHSKAERPKEQLKKQKSTSSRDSESSDCSYDFVQDLNPKSSLKRTPEEEQELLSKYKGKHGLKYQKISNELRQKLIKQVTTTGCTIKSAARELNINFSTAKAIMQIYRKEGRTSKKIKRTKTLEELKNPEQLIQAVLSKEDQCQPKQNTVQDSIETIHHQQVEENNRNQAILIQQINAQVRIQINLRINIYKREQINYNKRNHNCVKIIPI